MTLMSKPIEFNEFYELLKAAKNGNKKKKENLDWILAEYEHAEGSENAYDELGQVFCHIGVMGLYEYAGIDDLQYINHLKKSVWEYLEVRMGINLTLHMVETMMEHAKQHELSTKMSDKWDISREELAENMEGLAKYVAEGIADVFDQQ